MALSRTTRRRDVGHLLSKTRKSLTKECHNQNVTPRKAVTWRLRRTRNHSAFVPSHTQKFDRLLENMLQGRMRRRRKSIKPGSARWASARRERLPGTLCYIPPEQDPIDRMPVSFDRPLQTEQELALRNLDCPHLELCLGDAVEHMHGGRRPFIERMRSWVCSRKCPYREEGEPISAIHFLGARNEEIGL